MFEKIKLIKKQFTYYNSLHYNNTQNVSIRRHANWIRHKTKSDHFCLDLLFFTLCPFCFLCWHSVYQKCDLFVPTFLILTETKGEGSLWFTGLCSQRTTGWHYILQRQLSHHLPESLPKNPNFFQRNHLCYQKQRVPLTGVPGVTKNL